MATIFYKKFFKNILLLMNGRRSKIRSVHTYGVSYIPFFATFCTSGVSRHVPFNLFAFDEKFSQGMTSMIDILYHSGVLISHLLDLNDHFWQLSLEI